jgi:hypothetical protein
MFTETPVLLRANSNWVGEVNRPCTIFCEILELVPLAQLYENNIMEREVSTVVKLAVVDVEPELIVEVPR